MKSKLVIVICVLSCVFLSAQQSERWQQRIQYKMDIDLDVETNQFVGKQHLVYTNNSPDTLNRVFYHLFFNAFQPGSMMDVRSRTIVDPDSRVGDRIFNLKQDEWGYHKINKLEMDGSPTRFKVVGTILEVDLPNSILPGESTVLYMEFDSQVPLQVRRSGRDSKEGIEFSMTQWYPKLCEYDYQGWHSNPYVGREFHGVWGDFDVTIHLDPDYIVGAGGVLINADEIGYGKKKMNTSKSKKRTWKYRADNVHDFAWSADPDYNLEIYEAHDGTKFHLLYQDGKLATENWPKLAKIMDEALRFINARFGKYPYPVYNFLQGGDGGMEYPMATLIRGERNLTSLVGVSVHEIMHSWYQMILATNEALYPWMDEGFTSFASVETMNHLRSKGLIPGEELENPMFNTTRSFASFATSGREEALSTHADHYVTNSAYGVASYSKGAVFISQLEYILGKEDFAKGLLRYFHDWKFKHPNPNDFIRSMEKVSGLELDWYKEYMVNTTHTIDYAISDLVEKDGNTIIQLEKIGIMPMPLDIVVELEDGRQQLFNIPLRIMRGEKNQDGGKEFVVTRDWPWTNATYELLINQNKSNIKSVKIDPNGKMADVDTNNNTWPVVESEDKGS